MPEIQDIQRLRKDVGDSSAMETLYSNDPDFRATVDKYKPHMEKLSPVARIKFPTAMLNKHYEKSFAVQKPVSPFTTQLANNAQTTANINAAQMPQNQGALGYIGETIGNIPESAVNYGKGIWDAVTNIFNPDMQKNTVANVGRLGLGAGINAVEGIAGQDVFNNPFGSEDVADAAGQYVVERYGSLDAAAETLKTDPVGFLSDISTLVSGIGGAVNVAGKAGMMATRAATLGSKAVSMTGAAAKAGKLAGNVSKVGATIGKAGFNAEPFMLAGKAVKGGMKFGRYGVGQLTGFSDDTIKTLMNTPDQVGQVRKGAITRETIAEKVFKATQTKMDDLSDTGKVYSTIRKSEGSVTVPRDGIRSVLEDMGIGLDDSGRIIVSAESIPMKPGDVSALQDFVQKFAAKDELSKNGFLNARQTLSQMADYASDKSGSSKVVAKALRSHYDTVGSPQISGLKELDHRFAPLKDEAGKLRKEYLEYTMDEAGNRVPVLKPNATSKIANMTKKGREAELARLEKMVPGITEEINALRAIEDVTIAGQHKVGTYMRGGIGGFVLSGGNPVAAVAASIMASPSVAVPIITWYGRLKKLPQTVTKGILQKLRTGEKLTDEQAVIMANALDEAENLNTSNAQKMTPSRGAMTGENRLIELKGGQRGRPGIDKPAPLPQPQAQKSVNGGSVGGVKSIENDARKGFTYIRNTEKSAKTMNMGQDIEPAGKYMTMQEPGTPADLPTGWERGTIQFDNPLVIEWGSARAGGWKTKLSEQFGGKKGKELSQAIKEAGYDGIITVDGKTPQEIISLKDLSPSPKALPRDGATAGIPKGLEPLAAKAAQDYPSFIKYDYESTSLPLDQIKQREVVDLNSDKFKEIKKAVSRGDRTPIIVDESNFILDGHHRFNAYKESGANYGEIPVLKATGKGTGQIRRQANQ